MRIWCLNGHTFCAPCKEKIQTGGDDDEGPACALCREPMNEYGIHSRALDILQKIYTTHVCLDCGKGPDVGHDDCPRIKAAFAKWTKQLNSKRKEERVRMREGAVAVFKLRMFPMLFERFGVWTTQKEGLRRHLTAIMLKLYDGMQPAQNLHEALRNWEGAVDNHDWIEDARCYLKKRNLF